MNKQNEALNEMQKNAEELGLAYCKHGSNNACKECYMEQAEAEKQEPVAWLSTESKANEIIKTNPTTWQSLSDVEICDLWSESSDDVKGCIRLGYTTQQHYFASLIEQALKEKNHGK